MTEVQTRALWVLKPIVISSFKLKKNGRLFLHQPRVSEGTMFWSFESLIIRVSKARLGHLDSVMVLMANDGFPNINKELGH